MNRESESVYPLNHSSDEEEEDDDVEEGDIEYEEEVDEEIEDDEDEYENVKRNEDSSSESDDGMPAAEAWGKKRSAYYSTDYVDKDFGGYDSDAELADQEEQEALALQQKLVADLDEDDFDLQTFKEESAKSSIDLDQKVSVDISELGESEKLKLLQTESPEILGMIKEIEDMLKSTSNQFNWKNGSPTSVLQEHENIKLNLVLSYCINAIFYLAMKAKKSSAYYHPVMKRLMSYQKLLQKLPGVETLKQISHFEKPRSTQKEKPTRSKKEPIKSVRFEDVDDSEDEEEDISRNIEDDEDLSEEESEKMDEEVIPDGKRAINQKIAQNRGLTPHRKKEYKNPRVKHRLKFRKAKIRRQGQVREPRTELKRYGGEISGIKIGVKKSIRLG